MNAAERIVGYIAEWLKAGIFTERQIILDAIRDPSTSYQVWRNGISRFYAACGVREQQAMYDDVVLDGESAQVANVYMTSYKNTEFTYDAETGEYLLSQYNSEYIDGGDESRVSVKNVVVIFAETKVIDSKARLRITLTGSGEGYFICGGKYVTIEWSKESAADNFVFKDANGETIAFERGTTYVCICSAKEGSVSFE